MTNDLWVSNGKQSHSKSLGLSMTKQLNIQWPSSEQIATRTKRETFPLTFRIDEIAYASLDLLAKQYQISLSNFVNELINSFLEQNRQDIDGYVLNRVINFHMERVSAKLMRLSEVDIVKNFHLDEVKAVLSAANSEMPDDSKNQEVLMKDFFHNVESHGYAVLCDFGFFDADVRLVSDKYMASLVDKTSWTDEEKNEIRAWNDYSLNIPASKWNTAAAILCEFQRKVRQLCGKQWSNIALNDEKQTLTEIVAVINNYTGAELITKLTQSLRLPEHFME